MASNSGKANETVTPEHAIIIPSVPVATSVIPYIQAISNEIGSSHIHSVLEDQNGIKVYFNDRKYVDFIVNRGLIVLGRQVNVEYAIPRSDIVILKKVDPCIPDHLLMKFLCLYGKPVSNIIREKVGSKYEFSHIELCDRKIYMNLFNDKKPPSIISIQYQDVSYRFEMCIEKSNKVVLDIDSNTVEDINEEEEIVDDAEESEVCIKPNIEELAMKSPKKLRVRNPTPAQLAYRARGKRKGMDNSATYAARRIKSKAAKGWYKAKDNVSNINKLTGKKMLSARGRKGRGGSTRGRGRPPLSTNSTDINMNAINGEDNSMDQASVTTELAEKQTYNISQYPLSTDELKKFMFQTRCHRAPIQVMREFLAKKNAPNAVKEFLSQLMEYHDAIKIQALRIRIRRLVVTLRNTMNEPSTQ